MARTGRHVLGPHRAANSVRQQLFSDDAHEHVRPRQQRPPERIGAGDLRAIGELGLMHDRVSGRPSSRHRPVWSKFSSARPIGSIRRWHPAQVGRFRCCSSRCRNEVAWPAAGPSRGLFPLPAAAGAAAFPSRLSRIHLPRTTGDVRFAADVSVNTLPCPSRPRRGLSAGIVTRRIRGPRMPSMP